jgi:hypothetical protein
MTLDHIEELPNPEIALSVYDQIFTAREGYEIFFTPRIPKKGVVVPAFYSLSQYSKQDYLPAFQAAIRNLGEDLFYMSRTERVVATYVPKPGFEKEFSEASRAGKTSLSPFAQKVEPIFNDWLVPLDMASGLDDIDINLEKALYSLNGRWGVRFSSDNHMLIGGPEEFIDFFFSLIGATVDEMVLMYLNGDGNENYKLNEFLPNLFGTEQALVYKEMYKSRKD